MIVAQHSSTPSVSAETYTLTLPTDRPFVYIDDPRSVRLIDLFVLPIADHIDITQESLEASDYDLLRQMWACYRASLPTAAHGDRVVAQHARSEA